MAGGRPPKPRELKRLQGYPGHHPQLAPVIVGGRVGPDEAVPGPAGLTPAQRKAWAELVGPLQRGGILDHGDMAVIEAAAVQLARAREARAVLNAEGLIYTGPHGTVAHPMVAIEREAWKEFRQIAGQLGIGPVARAKLDAGKPAASGDDELDRTLGAPARLAIVSN